MISHQNNFLVSLLLASVSPTAENNEDLIKSVGEIAAAGGKVDPGAWDNLAKSATTTVDTDAFKPESLEDEVTITTWRSSDEGINTGIKLLGSERATRLSHQYSTMESIGHGGDDGFMEEMGRAKTDRADFQRRTVVLKLMGKAFQTGKIAAMERVLRVGGTNNLAEINRRNAMAGFSRMRNKGLWYADYTKHRDGSDSQRFEGVFAAVNRLGAPNSVMDLRGERLTLDYLRALNVKKKRDFGRLNTLLMGPKALMTWEQDLDDKRRVHAGQVDSKMWRAGAAARSVIAAGREIRFAEEADFGFIPREAWKVYVPPSSEANAVYTGSHPSAPKTLCTATLSAAAVGGSRISLFVADDEGDYTYFITEVVNGVEGRAHNANGTTVTVAAGEEVTIAITPSSSAVESFKIYRTSGPDADPDYGEDGAGAFLMAEVASSANGTTVTTYDLNADIPGSEDGFMMHCENAAWNAVFKENDGNFNLGIDALAKLPRMAPGDRDSIGFAHLGDSIAYQFDFAKLLLFDQNAMAYGVGAPIIRNKWSVVRIKNIGRP
jgi:hypothetical protein